MAAGRKPKAGGRKAREGARAISPNAIDPRDLADPPTNLGKWGRHAWFAAMRSLGQARVLAECDLLMLEACCREWARWREIVDTIHALEKEHGALKAEISKTPNGHMQMSALRISANNALKNFRIMAGDLGMTPISRIKTTGSAQGDLFRDLEGAAEVEAEAEGAAPDPGDPFAGYRMGPPH